MKILVIGGGVWDEREISLRSATAVFEEAKQIHYTELYDWDGSENWLQENLKRFDVVLPILHGVGGEDGTIQKILEENGSRYLGSNPQVSKLCFDKTKLLQVLRENNIITAKSKLVTMNQYLTDSLSSAPHVLKPFNSGSSVDTFIFKDTPKPNHTSIADAFSRHPKMILEEYIDGTEITIPILDGKRLDIIEIIPPVTGTFDYVNKYNGATQELVPPKNVSKKLQLQAYELGQRIHELVGCRHLSRTDAIIKDDALYVLELNTLPGMTDQSLFPKAAAAAGIDFSELVDYFINMVVADES